MKKIKVSIIIPSWFEPGMTGRYNDINETYMIASQCLKRLLEVTPRDLFELIIVDNGSTLKTEDVPDDWLPLEWYWDQADILIKNETNLGFGGALNQAIAKANGEFVLQLNNDILMWSDWLEEILDVFEQPLEPPVGMVMPALEKSGRRFEEIINCKKEDIDMTINADKYGVHAQFGSCWCMKKSLLDKLYKNDGFYFDPQFKMLFKEDRDLYQRVYQLGLETYRAHRVRVHHVGNVSVSKLVGHKDISKNNRKLYEKKWSGKEK